jgi:nitroreductase
MLSLESTSNLIKAIETRRSCRQFQPERLDEEHLLKISQFIDEINAPFPHNIRFTIHETLSKESILHFKEPPQFIAFHSPTDDVIDQAKLGFLGELVILYCESIGVNTCWMGHYKKKQVNTIVNPQGNPGDYIFCISPLGHASKECDWVTKLSQWSFSPKRKPASDFLQQESLKDYPEQISRALELARYAPSAMNTQKWYHKVANSKDGYLIEHSKPEGYQHFKWRHYDIDVGAAAAHIWLGLQNHFKVDVKLENKNSNAVWTFTLQ